MLSARAAARLLHECPVHGRRLVRPFCGATARAETAAAPEAAAPATAAPGAAAPTAASAGSSGPADDDAQLLRTLLEGGVGWDGGGGGSGGHARARSRQLAREAAAVTAAVHRHARDAAAARARGDVAASRPAVQLIASWHRPLVLALRGLLEGGGDVAGKEVLVAVGAEKLAAIVVYEVVGILMKDLGGVTFVGAAVDVGDAVRAEVNMGKIRELRAAAAKAEKKAVERGAGRDEERKRRRSELLMNMATPTTSSAINFAAVRADVEGSQWDRREKVVLGSLLIETLLSATAVEARDAEAGGVRLVPAFRHDLRFNAFARKRVGMLHFSDPALRVLMEDEEHLRDYVRARLQPMVVPPRPWMSPAHGPYLSVRTALVRAEPSRALDDALANADLHAVCDGLNALGSTAWKVNKPVLSVARRLWDEKRAVAGLVDRRDMPMPKRTDYFDPGKAAAFAKAKKARTAQEKDAGEGGGDGEGVGAGVEARAEAEGSEAVAATEEENAEAAKVLEGVRAYRRERRKVQKLNREMFSLRAHTGYQLDEASGFADEERLYLPHNVDFRGRAYPIPVYLQHMGADLMRSMLTFSSGVPLGDRGLYWLKVHLANLLGADKLSFDDRVAAADDALPRALAVAADPLSDANLEWWSSAEDPFQLLAACAEFGAAAGRHGGGAAMRAHHSALAISMDGSCNGLQHYAALGRDAVGGAQVNLVASPRPQDVYSGVADLVRERVRAAAADGDHVARLLDGVVTRKVVKQTVMTSVYGVTLIGARAQIEARLRESGRIPEEHLFAAGLQLARWTLASLGDIFSGATRTMDWLAAAARAVSRLDAEVQWLTPLGLPVIQPYRKRDTAMVRTAVQRVKVGVPGEHMPVSRVRQTSAFAPNFVHSIDSSHMLLTAVACRERGLAFAAVHDSFWTHAAHVDDMNAVLRATFVDLHRRKLLVELRDAVLLRHPRAKLPPLPERGELQLDAVLESPYFFS